MSTLYIVPTPIGNLEDITLRALRVLREVTLIAAEDTRVTGRLLAHFDIKTPQISYHEHNRLARLEVVLAALAQGDVALVSDAGTPGLSDPGLELIQAAIGRGITVCPLPGPSAVLPALVASGMPTDTFMYVGFLPRKQAARRAALVGLSGIQCPLILYEAPHRVTETLADIVTNLGDRPIAIAREISKLYEEIWRGTAAEALDEFSRREARGEFVLVVAGAAPPTDSVWESDKVRSALSERLAAGEPRSAAARAVAREAGWQKGDVYDLDV